MLSTSLDSVRSRAQAWQSRLAELGVAVELAAAESTVGGGSLPGERLPTTVVVITPRQGGATDLLRRLREHEPPVIGRIVEERMLLVAADEGPMPQTREHLAIIDLLAIQHGLVVLTKADLVDAAWLRLMREEVAGLIQGTAMQRVPIVAVSGTSGEGLDELRAALDAELAQTQPRPDVGRPRLPVDRSFAMAGFGTVVTGTLVGGALRQGAEVIVMPGERRVRIRGLQQHTRPVGEERPGSRTAVNLSGVDHSQLRRGHVLALPGPLPVTRRLDARLVVLPNAAQPLRHRQRLLIYHETAEAMVELSLLEADELRPGEEGWGQLYVTSAMVALDGD